MLPRIWWTDALNDQVLRDDVSNDFWRYNHRWFCAKSCSDRMVGDWNGCLIQVARAVVLKLAT